MSSCHGTGFIYTGDDVNMKLKLVVFPSFSMILGKDLFRDFSVVWLTRVRYSSPIYRREVSNIQLFGFPMSRPGLRIISLR